MKRTLWHLHLVSLPILCIMARISKPSSSSDESQVQAAIRAYKAGKFSNIRDAATAHGITYGKLRNRLAGIPTRTESHISQQNLTPAEERVLVSRILQLDQWGFPPQIQYIRDLATHFIRSHGRSSTTIGKNWTTQFLKRHPSLDSKFAARLDKQRGFANNPVIVRDFFTKVVLIILS